MARRSYSYRYDIALSFAGEDREQAKILAAMLKRRGLRIFYDEYEREGLMGETSLSTPTGYIS
jgi:hypothetical protein